MKKVDEASEVPNMIVPVVTHDAQRTTKVQGQGVKGQGHSQM